jgi:hypothetical protein
MAQPRNAEAELTINKVVICASRFIYCPTAPAATISRHAA